MEEAECLVEVKIVSKNVSNTTHKKLIAKTAARRSPERLPQITIDRGLAHRYGACELGAAQPL